ncbi:MAG: hypothetical protein RL161_557, partial [Bacteroidota bacterium]
MEGLVENNVSLSRGQISKLRNGAPVTIGTKNFQNPNMLLKLSLPNQMRLMRSIKKGKGCRICLGQEEIEGNGFFSDVGKFFKKTAPKLAKKALPVVAKPLISMGVAKATAMGGPLGGLVANELGKVAQSQVNKMAGQGFLKNTGKSVGKAVAKKGVDMVVSHVASKNPGLGGDIAKIVGNEAKKQIGSGIMIKPIPIRAMQRVRGRPVKDGGALFSKKALKSVAKQGVKLGLKEGAKVLKKKGVPSDLVDAVASDMGKMVEAEKVIVPKASLREGLDYGVSEVKERYLKGDGRRRGVKSGKGFV